ncbi:hypothetical protein GOFOIKOB_4534 [Methylobacterium tardum]|uniref:Uncharacterized protein n=1 Tax=Methylobacterium tardum TaxID=374432 RepID=A0AA37TLP2_9HYPH|nr:hypothetical protein [Methylobacterium tardum]URD39444.1 hypothetical protein M6G65_14165 [Methylobacterium tardum]GJE51475.1 hypothetical protein GOFOIKOB_4534 [Methylobacterium tardum]GLS73628.1 hypothetical protein GCM10007890_56430 [Methylobacterium tardum]
MPGAANVPAALGRAFEAIRMLDAAHERKDLSFLPVVRHDLYRILDELTGCDHSGCTSKPSVADYGRVVDLEVRDPPKRSGPLCIETTTHADGSTRVRTGRA